LSVISTVAIALSAYNPAIGEWKPPPGGATTDDHVTVNPVYDRSFEADDAELVVDEYIDCHFFKTGDFQSLKTAAKAALIGAGLAIDEYRYIECDNEQHHFVLTVIGRA
jgi:hypothetical protein